MVILHWILELVPLAVFGVVAQKVGTEGTGTAAALDFTNVVGKTGTSTGPKDVWFVGFTGKLVAGVWLGNDDNHPMQSGVTGGHQAAPVWHSFMQVAHTDMNIPPIPGLQMHPRQIAERDRVAELKKTDPELAAALLSQGGSADGQRKSGSMMSETARDNLRKLAQTFRKAGGIPEPAPAPAPAAAPGTPGHPGAPPAARPPGEGPKPTGADPGARDRRADGTPQDRGPASPPRNGLPPPQTTGSTREPARRTVP